MSASTEKRNRQAARQAGTDKKQLAAQEAAKKAAVSKRRWTLGTIAVIVLIPLIILLSSPLMYRITTAETIGAKSYSPADVRYQMQSSNYAMYVNYLGEDFARQMLENNMVQSAALLQNAKEEGLSLTEMEKAVTDSTFESLEEGARSNKVSLNRYIAAVFGKGVNRDVIRKGLEEHILSSKAYNTKLCSLNFTDEELDAYYEGLNGEGDLFSYALYTVAVSEELPDAEAAAAAEALKMSFQDGEGEDYTQRLNDILAEEFPGESAQERTDVVGSSLDESYKDWLLDSRQAGDVYVTKNTAGDGYHVVVFLSRNDNSETVARVRHILIKAQAEEDGSYTEEAKAAAKARAEEILAGWESGEKTEAEFATLAELYSEDSGSNSNGGLYADITPGQTVEEFDRFCFEEHSYGDTAVVYGESGAYAGYHIIFYLGNESAARSAARTALTTEAMNQWVSSLTEGLEPVYHWAYKLV